MTDSRYLDIENLTYKAVNPLNSGSDADGSLEYMATNGTEPRTPMRRFLLDEIGVEGELWDSLENAEPRSSAEHLAARKLAQFYLVKQAARVVQLAGINDETSQEQAGAFTNMSREIYGSQDSNDFYNQLREDSVILSNIDDSMVDSKKLTKLRVWHGQLQSDVQTPEEHETTGSIDIDSAEIFESLSNVFIEKYGVYVQHLDSSMMYGPKELFSAASVMLSRLKEDDPRWEEWQIEMDGSSGLSVSANDKKIYVGVNRSPSIGSETAASLTHELFIHALRNVNVSHLDDEELSLGMQGYGGFEEGLGQFCEFLMTGKTPSKIANRVLAAGLAEGIGLEKGYDKNRTLEFLTLRAEVMMQAEGIDPEDEYYKAKIAELKTLIVNRFYRGGTGLEGGRAVFTKDIMYAQGYETAKTYLRTKLEEGYDPAEMLEYVTTGKTDLTNPEHVERLAKHGIVLQKH